jgi:hypothetical protein
MDEPTSENVKAVNKLDHLSKHQAVVTAVTLLQKDFITLYNRLNDGQYQTHMTRAMKALISYKEYGHKLRNVLAVKNTLIEAKNITKTAKDEEIINKGSAYAKAKVLASREKEIKTEKLGTSHLTPMQYAMRFGPAPVVSDPSSAAAASSSAAASSIPAPGSTTFHPAFNLRSAGAASAAPAEKGLSDAELYKLHLNEDAEMH